MRRHLAEFQTNFQLIFPYSKYRNRRTIFERLEPQQINQIRLLIHEEFQKHRNKQEVIFPTIESIHQKIQESGNFQFLSNV